MDSNNETETWKCVKPYGKKGQVLDITKLSAKQVLELGKLMAKSCSNNKDVKSHKDFTNIITQNRGACSERCTYINDEKWKKIKKSKNKKSKKKSVSRKQ
jgi:hypothetical protein